VRIRPDQTEDIRKLFESVMDPGGPGCRGIVHLWSLDVSCREDATASSMEAAQTLGCLNVLRVVQEMADARWSTQPRLWLVTRGSQAGGDDSLPVEVAQAPLWGLGRVIAQEHPTLWGGIVDLEPQSRRRNLAAHQLWEEISNPDGEDQVAFRRGQRMVSRLARKHDPIARKIPLQWRTDASYLITGGLGDLGLKVARWMVEQGARRLILLGRSKLPPRSR